MKMVLRLLLTRRKTHLNTFRLFSSILVQEKKIKIDKWNINYIKVGKGQHYVFCLPGALGTIWTSFRPQIEGFDREKFTLVVWDPPGFGKSRPPNKEFTLGYYERDADLAYQFMKTLGIPKYSLMGWSDGSEASWFHAAKYPEVINKLVAISTGSKFEPEKLKFMAELRDINTWTETVRKPLVEIYGDELSDYWNAWVNGHTALLTVNDGHICSHLLKDIKCPTYILQGARDRLAPLHDAVGMAKAIVGAKLHVYPDGKHNIHIKYAEDFNKRVHEFLLQP